MRVMTLSSSGLYMVMSLWNIVAIMKMLNCVVGITITYPDVSMLFNVVEYLPQESTRRH